MTDKIRQAAEKCAEDVLNTLSREDGEVPEDLHLGATSGVIESAMRELLAAQPEASSSVRLDGETHCVSESPTPASEEELVKRLIEKWQEPGDDENIKRMIGEEIQEKFMPTIRAYVAERTDAATLAEHKSHVEYENELYATLVDPVAEGPIKEAEMRKQLLESARWYRQHVYDLETQLNAVAERVKEAERHGRKMEARWWVQHEHVGTLSDWAAERIAELEVKK